MELAPPYSAFMDLATCPEGQPVYPDIVWRGLREAISCPHCKHCWVQPDSILQAACPGRIRPTAPGFVLCACSKWLNCAYRGT